MKAPSGKHFECPAGTGTVLQIFEVLLFTKTVSRHTHLWPPSMMTMVRGNLLGMTRVVLLYLLSQILILHSRLLWNSRTWEDRIHGRVHVGPQSSQTYQSCQRYKVVCWMLDGQRKLDIWKTLNSKTGELAFNYGSSRGFKVIPSIQLLASSVISSYEPFHRKICKESVTFLGLFC